MNIHWLQHVRFEGLGSIRTWAEKRGHKLIVTKLWAEEKLPDPEDVKMVIVMGGPMGVYDDKTFPWLAQEKQFLSHLLKTDCALLGICLGAQLLAAVLGARVQRNREKEIGWFPVTSAAVLPPPFNTVFPDEMTVFHWHGDTFDIPSGGKCFGSSEACRHQAFIAGDRILGLQYHLEMTPSALSSIIHNCREELVDAEWIQSEEEITRASHYLTRNNRVMEQVLDRLADLAEKKRR